jgi:aryl-alcohol dehydrogenase-like predicted oxidoreductase
MFGATEFDPSKETGGPSIHEQVSGMAAMIKAGKIRYYGLSNETSWGVCEFQRAAAELGFPGPVTLQNSYSLLSRNVDNDLAETLFREDISLLAYSPPAASCRPEVPASATAERAFTLSTDWDWLPQADGREAIEAYAALAKRRNVSLCNSRWAT